MRCGASAVGAVGFLAESVRVIMFLLCNHGVDLIGPHSRRVSHFLLQEAGPVGFCLHLRVLM